MKVPRHRDANQGMFMIREDPSAQISGIGFIASFWVTYMVLYYKTGNTARSWLILVSFFLVYIPFKP